MYIRIDTSSGVPIWQQIVAQVTKQAVSGAAEPGDQLPTVRELASELRVNPNTVAKAYQELERDGVVESKRGTGTFILERSATDFGPEAIAALNERIDAAIVEAMQIRISEATFIEIVHERMHLFTNHPMSADRKPNPELPTKVKILESK